MEEELLQFLTAGNKNEVQSQALEAYLALTAEKKSSAVLANSELHRSLSRIVQADDEQTCGLALKIVTNLVATHNKLARDSQFTNSEFLKHMVLYIIDQSSKDADTACMLMSNLSRTDASARLVLTSLGDAMTKVVSALVKACVKESYNASSPMHHVALFVANLTALREVRTLILDKTTNFISQLLAFTLYRKSSTRRSGIVRIIRNCSFDDEFHPWLLSEDVAILPRLMLPLAGPEEFDDEDNEELPLDLQYLPNTTIREPCAEIRKLLIETLTQLCSTKFGRRTVRKNGVYLIMRELHKAEEDPSVDVAVENLIHIIIGDEPEEGMENLRSIEVPEKVSKALEVSADEKET